MMSDPTIWTIGYEKTTPDAVLAALQAAGVEVLAYGSDISPQAIRLVRRLQICL